MKKILFILVFILAYTSSYSQDITYGSLDCLTGGKIVKVVLDFSNSTIDKFDYETMCELDEDWTKAEKEMSTNFIKIVAEELSWHNIKVSNKSDLSFVFVVNKVDDDGEIYADAKLVDQDGTELLIIKKFNGDGGRGKTIAKRASSAVERMAKSVGRFFDSQKRQDEKKEKQKNKR